MPSSQDRRRAPRTASTVPFDIYDNKGRVVVGEGRFLNLSTTGGRMVTRKVLKADAVVHLHVVPNGKPALELTGKVVWARKKTSGFEYGIRFKPHSKKPIR